MSDYQNSTARLGPQQSARSGGKKIDTWTFTRPVLSRDVDPKRKPESAKELEVYLMTTPKGFSFEVRGKDLPPGHWADSDLQKLRERVLAAMKKQDEITAGIQWEPWLEVQTSLTKQRVGLREEHEHQHGRELTITYRPLLRGVHPLYPDRILTVNSNGVAVDFPLPLTPQSQNEEQKHTVTGTDKEGVDALIYNMGRQDRRTQGDTYAYLPDTPDNRAAIDQILAGMETLGERLHHLLSPTKVSESVANIGQSFPGLLLSHEAPGATSTAGGKRRGGPG